eukprot:6878287-Prymnesium_polylepis.1
MTVCCSFSLFILAGFSLFILAASRSSCCFSVLIISLLFLLVIHQPAAVVSRLPTSTSPSDWRREPQIIDSADRAGWRCPKFGGVVFTPHGAFIHAP